MTDRLWGAEGVLLVWRGFAYMKSNLQAGSWDHQELSI